MTDAAFEPFGTSHLVMLGLFVAGIVPLVLLGRRCRGRAGQRVSRGFAVAVVAFLVPLQVIDFLPSRFDLDTTLPLQLSDLSAVAAVVGLWSHRRTAVALTYYWGLLLTPQALLTPALASDFPDPRFIAFFGLHILVVWAAVFLVGGLGLHPGWRELGRTVAITAGWMVAVYLFNLALDTNYGFVNAKPGTASVLDLLGPWPVYLLWEVLIVAALWALMTWPWTRRLPPPTSPS